MSANGSLPSSARTRLLAFNGFVWILGIVVVILIGVVSFSALPSALGDVVDEQYRYEPWENPDPVLAEDEGGGVYSGVDGAMIRLDGLDPSTPLLVEELDDTYVGSVTVTGPGGEILSAGPYGGPPEFDSWATLDQGGAFVLVTSSSAELWIDGFSDERWRARITPLDLDEREGSVSGFGSATFVYRGGASTARVAARGEGSVGVHAITAGGAAELVTGLRDADRSIAWEDADYVIFAIEAYVEAGWTIEFPESTPTPAPAPVETGAEG